MSEQLAVIWQLADKLADIISITFYGFAPGWGEVQFLDMAGDTVCRQFSNLDQLKEVLEAELKVEEAK